eukprot:jgi/Botrbrau1/22658/Bobra.0132s0004.1
MDKYASHWEYLTHQKGGPLMLKSSDLFFGVSRALGTARTPTVIAILRAANEQIIKSPAQPVYVEVVRHVTAEKLSESIRPDPEISIAWITQSSCSLSKHWVSKGRRMPSNRGMLEHSLQESCNSDTPMLWSSEGLLWTYGDETPLEFLERHEGADGFWAPTRDSLKKASDEQETTLPKLTSKNEATQRVLEALPSAVSGLANASPPACTLEDNGRSTRSRPSRAGRHWGP